MQSEEDNTQREEAVRLTEDIEIPSPGSSGFEVEEFATKIIKRAASLNGVKINRGVFLRTTLKKYCPNIDANLAVETTPIAAGISAANIDVIAHAAIDFETKKCAGLSFLAGVPGGVALAGTIPADLTQYFAHVMRVEQKLAYLYGWQSFLDGESEIDDETIMALVLLMGVMLGIGGTAGSITKFATKVAQEGVTKTIQRQALTKTAFYPLMKSVLKAIGVKVTKEAFAQTVSKAVPVIGGVVSGGITYIFFKPEAERLRRYLRALPMSGIDQCIPEIFPESKTQEAVFAASDKMGDLAASAAEHSKVLGTKAREQAQIAGDAIASGAKKTGKSFACEARAAGDFLGSIKKNHKDKVKKMEPVE